MKLNIIAVLMCIFLFGCNNDQSKRKIVDKKLIKESNIKTSKKDIDLYHTIKLLDSLFFDVAYNKCDTIMGRKLVSNDFEFYHDKGGTLLNEPNELAADVMVEDLSWICKDTYRKLVGNSMQIYPLYEDNKLYGVLQTGEHQFYNVENNTPIDLKSIAKFTHLWILEGSDWKLKIVFSYDHQKAIKN
jgi:hypothetical protein